MSRDLSEAVGRVAGLMPQLVADLERLVAVPSVSATDYPPETHEQLLAARLQT